MPTTVLAVVALTRRLAYRRNEIQILKHMKRKLFATFALALAGCLFGAINSPAAVHYVNVNGANPTPPYTNWIKAATHIQDAVNAAAAGDTIIVTNGTYPGTLNVTNPLALASVNGPQFTTIDGGRTNRCASLTTGASLTGFTLRNGSAYWAGGGVFCWSTNAFLTNCVITGNNAKSHAVLSKGTWVYIEGTGGGVYGGTLYNCIVSLNFAQGIWEPNGSFRVFDPGRGGGVAGGTLFNCLVSRNRANAGGGTADCNLYNCTLSGNACDDSSKVDGTRQYHYAGNRGGAAGGTLYNCIAYFNSATNGANCGTDCVLNYCCTTPLPANGVGNITNAPLFVDTNGWSNLHLRTNSPGINAGNNAYVATATDLEGNPRIAGGTADMGAYEFQPGVCGGRCDGAVCSPGAGFGFVFCGGTMGQPYRIQTSTTLAAGNWIDLTNFNYAGPIVITDPSAAAGPKKFYRAVSP